jgi:hypothetical protein
MQAGSPASGWEYLWNRDGVIGDPSHYVFLLPTTNSSYYYDADGIDGLAGADEPASFVYMGVLDSTRPTPGVPGGHPGRGFSMPTSGGIERYAIAAFTIPTSGNVSIVNSLLTNADTSSDGLHLRVYAGNSATAAYEGYTLPGLDSSLGFDTSLGYLAAGEKIYVGIGGNGDEFYDTFRLRYTIDVTVVPAPSSLTCLIGIGVMLGGMKWWKKHRRR